MQHILIVVAIIALIIGVAVIVAKEVNKDKYYDLYRFSTMSKGDYGEYCVSEVLGYNIEGVQYVINNLLFIDDDGKSRQIDHIYINKYGIWVIETKNYAGYIYGTDKQLEWTQVLAGGREKNKFYNPVRQNTSHIYCLSKKLQVRNVFHNVVVFLYRADISHVKSENVYSWQKLNMIKSQPTETLLSPEQMKVFYGKLIALQSENTVTTDQHIENIHKMREDLKLGVCPRCGSKLVLRNGKNGMFYGCSSYPKCKFTKQIDGGEKTSSTFGK